jgi:predicted metal-dependent HD superfamily phosphohydrolase
MSLISEPIRAELVGAYSAPDRHYHSIDHVETLLRLMDEHAALLADPASVEAAIWFHDAVYDTHRDDNEVKSADLARERLCSAATENQLGCITTMIRATKDHALPVNLDRRASSDCALFLDMDLAILGATDSDFAAYERAVRLEYAWVSEPMWIAGRRRVLEGFLARPDIYTSPVFRSKYEAAARSNLMRAFEALGGQRAQTI